MSQQVQWKPRHPTICYSSAPTFVFLHFGQAAMTYCTPQFILSLVFVFWPGCHDTQSLLRGSFCQSPPLVAVQRHPASHCSGSVSLSRPLSTMLVNQHCLTSQLMLYFLQGAPCPHLTSFLASFIVLFSASHCCSKDSSAVNCVRCPPQDQFPRVAPLMPLCLPCLSLYRSASHCCASGSKSSGRPSSPIPTKSACYCCA